MIPVDRMLSERNLWFDGSGPLSDEILSTRVRLARNLRDFCFVSRGRDEELASIYQTIGSALGATQSIESESYTRIDQDSRTPDERSILTRSLKPTSSPDFHHYTLINRPSRCLRHLWQDLP